MSLAVIPLAITMNAGPQIMSAIIFVTASQAAEALGLLPDWRGYSRHRWRHYHLHPRQRARQQHLAGRLLRFRIARQHHPVPAGRVARAPVHQELRGPRDERTPKVAWRSAKRQAQNGIHDRVAAALGVPFRLRHHVTVGMNLAQNNASLLAAVPFIAATILIAALPVLSYLAVPSARAAGNAQGARVDEHEQLAGEHNRLHHVHLADPRIKSRGAGKENANDAAHRRSHRG